MMKKNVDGEQNDEKKEGKKCECYGSIQYVYDGGSEFLIEGRNVRDVKEGGG